MAVTSATVNVRLDRELKAAGEEALGDAGFSPSGAVRALYRAASRRGRDLERVCNALACADESDGAERSSGLADFRRRYLEIDAMADAAGLRLPRYGNGFPTDDELREEMYLEELAAMGEDAHE